MKVPISLLKEYLDFSLSPQELAEVFTLAGIEVEGIETLLEPYQDSVLDIALTPNLGHCMSTYGLARELGALLNLPIKNKPFTCIEEGDDIDKLIHVTIIDRKQCLRYACRVISGICVGPSPRWLQERLQMYGMRSINNVVDISNLVMLEWGQPLHIFDYDKIAQKKILVHAQTSFSHLQTLDEQLREIPPESLLICDPEKALAFAGVMGGKSSAVTEETRNILIESAYFTPQAIRKTGKWLGLRTEAGQRFEKGVDPNAIIPALNYAAYQLREVAGGKIAVGYIDQKVHAFEPKKIACRLSRINGLLGTQLSLRQAAQLLERLGIEIQERQTELIASLPTYRNDLSIEEDLIEEIARIYGYNNIQKSIPSHSSSTLVPASSYTLESRVRHGLLNEGLQEFLNCDLISPSQEQMLFENTLSQSSCVTVLHAKSAEHSVLRSSLLAGLLQVVKYNCDHYQRNIAGFEVGRVYTRNGTLEGAIFDEQPTFGVVLSGNRAPQHWESKAQEYDFFDLKGIMENLLGGLLIRNVRFEPSHLHNFHPNRQASVKIADVSVGVIGEVHPAHIEKLDIGQRVFFAECNLSLLSKYIPHKIAVVDSPLYPGSERDWTVTLKEQMPIQHIIDLIHKVNSPLLEKVSILGLYKSDQIGKDKKNATFRFFYRDPEKTLAFEAVEREHARIIQAVLDEV